MPHDENAGIIFERLIKLEGRVEKHEEQIDDMGGTIDHVVNTLDTIVLPTIAAHGTSLSSHEKRHEKHDTADAEAHDYIVRQSGAWQFIQRLGIVIAAIASVVTLVMKLKGL